MTDEQMNQLAEKIVDLILERQAELDEVFLADWQEEIIVKTQLQNEEHELIRLEVMLKKAIEDEEYELAAKLNKRINQIKNK
jgi:protein-arginine kinase activator protein McsA|tara:strand:+ start:395 stop:640 length:246 start_codon:yes stop_codon:yes gene_type:complete